MELYSILSLDSPEQNRFRALVRLDPSSAVYKGHFPNHPVTPGVCWLQMAKEILEQVAGRRLCITGARQIKCYRIHTPAIGDVVVEGQYTAADARVSISKEDDLVCRMNLYLK